MSFDKESRTSTDSSSSFFFFCEYARIHGFGRAILNLLTARYAQFYSYDE